MNHLPRIFGRRRKEPNNNKPTMDPKNILGRRKPKLERRNAAKHFDYDAGSEASSSSSGSVLYTRSMDFYDRTSFRIEGVEGEFDRICQSLGLSGPEDFAIPAAAWEAMKFRSSSDILPRLKANDLDESKEKEEIAEAQVQLGDEFEDRVSIRGVDECDRAETSCSSGGGGGGGIKGSRPPMLKPPPGVRVSVVDDACSTWELLRDFAPQGEGGKENYVELGGDSDEDEREAEKEEEEERGVSVKIEEEENAARFAELSGSCSFTTSNEDDSSSVSTDPRSNNISPNERFRRIITNWQKGELLGRGSFGSVYEGISE